MKERILRPREEGGPPHYCFPFLVMYDHITPMYERGCISGECPGLLDDAAGEEPETSATGATRDDISQSGSTRPSATVAQDHPRSLSRRSTPLFHADNESDDEWVCLTIDLPTFCLFIPVPVFTGCQ